MHGKRPAVPAGSGSGLGPPSIGPSDTVLRSATIVPATSSNLGAAAARLAAGGLVAFPTETVYGLGADAANADAVAAVYATKGRPSDHPLIVHVGNLPAAAWWAELPPAALRLAERFWPGPLTLIVPRRSEAPAFACANQTTVGLRCPSHPVAQELLARFHALGGRGVAAPSANRFGRISPTRARHVAEDLGEQAPPILDGGDAQVGIESTIVDLSRAAPVLLRPGAIDIDALGNALCETVQVSANVLDPRAVDAQAPKASGTLASHYAPRTPLSVVADDFHAALAAALERAERVAVWCRPDRVEQVERAGEGSAGALVIRQAPLQPDEYAHRLYATLRELDAAGCDSILVEAPPRDAAWQAVWDRLRRAASRVAPG